MFLKQDTFNYGDQSVVMTELSGLQRVEYLAFVQKRTTEFDTLDDAMPVAERQIEFLRMGMDINAWLVSRSVWNTDPSQDVDALNETIKNTWSYDALGDGGSLVLSLSGMPVSAGDNQNGGQAPLTPEKP
ncbi:phage minor tail protein G [Escherichia coli]|uniref:phage tail assembly chaperone G n=1 Tax=Escherichia coli TaxID=562 RepID=UPI000D16A426|nr:phage minor tail protein G [Escherichia coli]EGF1626185.1 phage minor tail protein G [Escherichia coli]EGK4048019.1 phage minor tail protein G [Escherichia coli]EGK4057673.1 phage minor tail protein G [Escherichia coli]PSY69692.1 phage minor tail protein G [Escherichia coli]PSZ11053.1 phage minor tail protein G [Escherichia coli]